MTIPEQPLPEPNGPGRSAVYRVDVAAMNEALLISALRQHELREEAEALNVRLVSEIAERKRVAESLDSARTELRHHIDSLEQIVAERTAQLRASMGELEAFSYSLAHDLRAPVRAIHGFTQMALDMPGDQVGPDAAELLRRVVTASLRMDGLIRDVLSLSRVISQPMERQRVDVDAMVRELVQERPEFSLPRAKVVIENPLLPVSGHKSILSQCLTNLMGNAVKFVKPETLPWVRVWSEEIEDARVRLWIEDRGIGIPPAEQKKLFEIFQRLHTDTRYEGSGIGLAIVRKGIERMGGSVGVESVAGEGSRFWLLLPKA